MAIAESVPVVAGVVPMNLTTVMRMGPNRCHPHHGHWEIIVLNRAVINNNKNNTPSIRLALERILYWRRRRFYYSRRWNDKNRNIHSSCDVETIDQCGYTIIPKQCRKSSMKLWN
jgi:hypothetical protein